MKDKLPTNSEDTVPDNSLLKEKQNISQFASIFVVACTIISLTVIIFATGKSNLQREEKNTSSKNQTQSNIQNQTSPQSLQQNEVTENQNSQGNATNNQTSESSRSNQSQFSPSSITPTEVGVPSLSKTFGANYLKSESNYNFSKNQRLVKIINGVVNLVSQRGLPKEDLYITLIDIKTNSREGYQPEILKYPASVVKMFWMIILYTQSYQGLQPDIQYFESDLYKMMVESDNESASQILDRVTRTKSGSELYGSEYENWIEQRQDVNRFFEQSGSNTYKGIDISQKTFPIPYLGYRLPEGRDLQMRGDPENPIRNKISTQQTAQLMYELVTERTIVPKEDIEKWLRRDLRSEAWQSIDPNAGDFNPVRTFFGEYLPPSVVFLSKAGWTSKTRQEVAFVETSEGKVRYVIAIFANNSAYAKDEKIFPEISKFVFQSMTKP